MLASAFVSSEARRCFCSGVLPARMLPSRKARLPGGSLPSRSSPKNVCTKIGSAAVTSQWIRVTSLAIRERCS